MALSDLTVYSEFTYTTLGEMLAQQIELFNAASGGTIVLTPGSFLGDYNDTVFWKKLSGLVRRRNAYGTGALTAINLEHLVETGVKVAAGTPPVEINPSQFTWIQQNPEVAAVELARQLAPEMMADFLNTAIGITHSALSGISTNITDQTGGTPTTATHRKLNQGSALLGDRSTDLLAWIMHSKVMHDLFDSNLSNTERLFEFGTTFVMRDFTGRAFIMTDSPNLINTTPTPDTYHTLGLTTGAVTISPNNDYIDNFETSNGNENIERTWQAEWTFQAAVKGFAWDKTNGGRSPTTSALMTGTNWDRIATSHKDLAGVIVDTK
jgi:hypothetical protein